MQERGARSALKQRSWAGVALVAGSVVLADQATKWWALRALDDRTIDLFWTLRLRLIFNRGTAFGLGSRYAPILAILAVIVVAVLLRTAGALHGRWPRFGLALVLGGAVGNLLDRILRPGGGLLGGAVVDFVDLQWWPVFNLADMAITGGAAVLALAGWRDPGMAEEQPAPVADASSGERGRSGAGEGGSTGRPGR